MAKSRFRVFVEQITAADLSCEDRLATIEGWTNVQTLVCSGRTV